jgi:hypothetical protein
MVADFSRNSGEKHEARRPRSTSSKGVKGGVTPAITIKEQYNRVCLLVEVRMANTMNPG